MHKLLIRFFTLLIAISGYGHAFAQPEVDIDSVTTLSSDTTNQAIQVKQFILPVSLASYGLAAVYIKPIRRLDKAITEGIYRHHKTFDTDVDDYLRYAPVAMLYGFKLAGVRSKHGVADQTALLLLSAAINTAGTGILKRVVGRERPNGFDNKSYPSGHASFVFMAAEMINREYGETSVIYPIIAYSIAMATGISRVYNKAHWFSDVVAGAGYGILATRLSYLAYPHIRKLLMHGKSSNLVLVPNIQGNYKGISMVYKFP